VQTDTLEPLAKLAEPLAYARGSEGAAWQAQQRAASQARRLPSRDRRGVVLLHSASTSLILILAVAASPALWAQIPADDAGQPFKLTVTAELVLLDVSVKSAAGERVANLNEDDFKVYENGKLQKLSQFGSDDVPVTVGLVIDTSGSMRTKYGHVVSAALAFLAASNPRDEMFLVNFGDRARLGLPENVPFTNDPRQLRSTLSFGRPVGRTALYDAILLALEHLRKGQRERKALVLVSDGGDNSSSHRSEEVTQMVRESRATIYTIGIFDADDEDRNPGLLQRLAQVSGGEAFFPKELSEVTAICQQIAADIRTRYTVGYVPVRSGEPASLRKIKVVVSGPGGHKLVVHTRTSYLLPDRSAS